MQVDIHFSPHKIQVPEIRAGRECGAVVEFQGIVRGTEDGEPIRALDYEAHPSMAEKELLKITSELAAKHFCDRLIFIHRVGEVPVGEMSLYLRVDARHRAEAFGFCQKLIDRMKQDVPIWKTTSNK
ncbi:MAG: molybdenum cofactor biosynthesis protein MoaE [Verrucomicrobiota bacterium]